MSQDTPRTSTYTGPEVLAGVDEQVYCTPSELQKKPIIDAGLLERLTKNLMVGSPKHPSQIEPIVTEGDF